MSKKFVAITGMSRSGSTFIWQIVNNINKFSIKRSHFFCNNFIIAFVTYRDFRDVLVSWSKSHKQTIPEIFNKRKRECFHSYLENLLKQKEAHWNCPQCYFIKYEDYFPNNTKALVEYIYTNLKCTLN